MRFLQPFPGASGRIDSLCGRLERIGHGASPVADATGSFRVAARENQENCAQLLARRCPDQIRQIPRRRTRSPPGTREKRGQCRRLDDAG